nr:immunoglobulin light chain junction region [Macaca mulatta]MOX47886.1 immunoglobulin light chain junction region [Macaca mulatta]MOX48535.1 immunoglobulin light chain junction region [Macaca mulatta]MOX48630.1 immunoglobulin light chain junction region [Macaca mulatta]MOX48738.1 immunoglobulin light chain junction region [Macaca mulatta]
CHQYNKWNTF